MRKLKENKMKKHILVLLLMLVFLFFGVRELNKLDETVKMPVIENCREEKIEENLVLAEEFDQLVNSISTPVTLEE